MGRSIATPGIESRVRAQRLQRGISQAELARRSGLTRQAISAVEAGQYVPNTAVALRLARSLSCGVEELFALPGAIPPDFEPVGDTSPAMRRMSVARVGERWLGYPISGEWEFQQGFATADALLPGDGSATPRLLTPTERLENTAVVLGCDPSLSIVAAHVAQRHPDLRLLWRPTASERALNAVARGEAHVAGSHLPDPDSSTYNLFHARRVLGRGGALVVELARWELGFVVAPGNPKSLRKVEDLARPHLTMVNREPGSGARALLDGLLRPLGLPGDAIDGYDRLAGSHLAAATAVASGGADIAVALRATALALGLDFVPLEQIRFDLVIPRAHLEHIAVSRLLDALQSEALRAELGALPGYDVSGMGSVHLDLKAGETRTRTRRASPRAGFAHIRS